MSIGFYKELFEIDEKKNGNWRKDAEIKTECT